MTAKSYRVRGEIVLEKYIDVSADSEQEAKRIALRYLQEKLEDLLVTQVSAWSHSIETEFTDSNIRVDRDALEYGEYIEAGDYPVATELSSKDYPK